MSLQSRIGQLERHVTPHVELSNEQRVTRLVALQEDAERDAGARQRFTAASRILDRGAARLAEQRQLKG